jgi:hypothetical protein
MKLKVSQMAADVMAKLPEVIDEVEVRRVMGEALQQPLNIVLLQEVRIIIFQHSQHHKIT